MPSISSLVANLTRDYPAIQFAAGSDFSWDPAGQTVFYIDNASGDAAVLLHEVAHALLGHTDYARDIELLRIERQAWQYAVSVLAPRYNVTIDEAAVEDALDTYRDWLHRRSLCPTCNLNGIQESRSGYRCIHCHEHWKVNEARSCRLKRTRLPKKNTPS